MATVAVQRQDNTFKERVESSDNRCVCQICTCHKHHCPPKHIAFNADTTNHELYKPHNVAFEKSRKCAYSLNKSTYDRDLLKSTYRVDYHQFPHESANPKSKYAYQPNTAKFYDETQYNKSYVKNTIEVRKPTPCQGQFRPNTARFDGTTTYGNAFKGKNGEQAALKNHYAYQSNNQPFYDHTTYGDSYKKYQVESERPRTCCHGQYRGNTGKFQDKTSYRDCFKGRQNPTPCRCLIDQLPSQPRECSPGKDHIHFCAHECSWK